MINPLVSIIIPIFNREKLIIETLNSLIKQSYEKWECILVDDGSNDNTFEIITQFAIKNSKIKIYKRPENLIKGACSCRNYGFKKATGKYINWFDSDDIMDFNFIKNKISVFKENENINCVISKTQFFSNDILNILGKEKRTHDSENLLEDFITLKRSWYVCDSMWSRKFLENKNLFSINLMKGQDRDFHIRMLMDKSFNLKFLDEYLTYYRQNENSISNNFSKNVANSIHNRLKERIIELKKHGISNDTLIFVYINLFKNYRYLRSRETDILKFIFSNSLKHRLFNKWLAKFIVASISYKITGKGDVFLK